MHHLSWITRLFHGRHALLGLLLVLLTACGVPIDAPVDMPIEATPAAFPAARAATTAPETSAAAVSPPVTIERTPLPAPPRDAIAPDEPACGVTEPSRAPARAFAELESGRLVSPRGVKPAQPYESSPLVRVPALESLLLGTLGDDKDRYAVVVQDLSTGRGAAINAERVFYAASVFKLTVMYEVFNQVSQGLLRLDDEVVITPYYEAFGLGPRSTALCDTLTIAEALHAMMSVSDNAVAVLLQDLVGSNAINASMEALGLTETRLLPEDLPLTASDVALLLDGIAHGDAISKEASTEMLRLLASEEIDNGMKAGVPAGTLVAHKTGNWSNATHDVGIVYAPNATYLLVVLSETNHESRVILSLSKAVYDYFANSR